MAIAVLIGGLGLTAISARFAAARRMAVPVFIRRLLPCAIRPGRTGARRVAILVLEGRLRSAVRALPGDTAPGDVAVSVFIDSLPGSVALGCRDSRSGDVAVSVALGLSRSVALCLSRRH